MSNEGLLVRYYELDGEYGVTSYGDKNNTNFALNGRVGSAPDWLTTIVNAGRIGSHGVVPTHPPPDFILWFRMDPDTGALVSFGRD